MNILKLNNKVSWYNSLDERIYKKKLAAFIDVAFNHSDGRVSLLSLFFE